MIWKPFHYVTVAIEYKYLKSRCESGCELSIMKLKKIDYIIIKDYKKLKSKLNKNKVDDIEKFCINKKIRNRKYLCILLEYY